MRGERGRLFFVSYAREDAGVARILHDALEELGFRVWLDEERMHPADPEALASTRIWDAIASATDFIAVVSRRAIEKPWVAHEWQIASLRWLTSGLPRVHVVHTEPDMPPIGLPATSVSNAATSSPESLERALTRGQPASVARPVGDADWSRLTARLRAKYLMGGPTAVQAVHELDALAPDLFTYLDEAVAGGFEGPLASRAHVVRGLGMLLDLRADRDWLERCLESACRSVTVSRDTIGILANNLGVTLLYGGMSGSARHWLGVAVSTCRLVGDVPGDAIGVSNLALVALEEGDLDGAAAGVAEARRIVDQALATTASTERVIIHELRHTDGLLRNHMGRIHALRGDFDRARRAFAEHLLIGEVLEDRRAIGVALGRLAWNDVLAGEPSWRSRAALARYRDLAVSSFNPRGIAHAASWEARVCLAQRSPAEARVWLREEIEVRRRRNDRVELARALAYDAIASEACGDSESAAGLAGEARALARTLALGRRDGALVAWACREPGLVRADLDPGTLAILQLYGA